MPFRIFKHWDSVDEMRQGVLVMVDYREHETQDSKAPIEVHFLQGFINDEKNIKTVDDFDRAINETKSRQVCLSVYDLPKLCAEVLKAAREVNLEAMEEEFHVKSQGKARKQLTYRPSY